MATTKDPEYMKQYRKTYAKKRINLTVSQQQYNLIAEAARPDESVPAATLRLALERLQEAPKIPELNLATAKEITRLVRNVANNVNQIAYNMNAARQIFGPGGHLEEPAQTLARLLEMFAELDSAVSRQLCGAGDET